MIGRGCYICCCCACSLCLCLGAGKSRSLPQPALTPLHCGPRQAAANLQRGEVAVYVEDVRCEAVGGLEQTHCLVKPAAALLLVLLLCEQ